MKITQDLRAETEAMAGMAEKSPEFLAPAAAFWTRAARSTWTRRKSGRFRHSVVATVTTLAKPKGLMAEGAPWFPLLVKARR